MPHAMAFPAGLPLTLARIMKPVAICVRLVVVHFWQDYPDFSASKTKNGTEKSLRACMDWMGRQVCQV